MGKVKFPIGENASLRIAVSSVNGEEGISARRDIIESISTHLEVVDFVPLGHIEEVESVAILADSPSAFRYCKTKFSRGLLGFGFVVTHRGLLHFATDSVNTLKAVIS